MPHDSVHKINEALTGLPLLDRMAALIASIVERDPRAPFAIALLIETAKVMTRCLPIEQRTAVVWYLNAAAAELEARWN
jgi:hypothetical protein